LDSVSDIFQLIIKDLNAIVLHNLETIPFKVFPNPTKGQFTICIGKINEYESTVEVIDLQGKSIIQQILNKEMNTTIDLSSYPKGTYLVKVNINGETNSGKIYLE
jgi:hypothetical protein